MHHRYGIPLAGLLVSCNALAATPAHTPDPLPAPIQALADQGVTIHQTFEAPGGLRAYGASAQGQEAIIYLTPDGQHAIRGTMTASDGRDLSEAQLDQYVRAPLEAQTWQLLTESHWVQDGEEDAPRIIYSFYDPNCTYCHQFWLQTRPWVAAGEVQIRHIMVGILAQDSPAKAASILAADDPSAALVAHHAGESIRPRAQPRAIEEQVYANNQLFDGLGLQATPTSAFQRETPDGVLRIGRIEGLPSEAELLELMGGHPPSSPH